jgi:hypothetical protein
LVSVVYKKRDNQKLFTALEDAENDKDEVRSLKDLEQVMGTAVYKKMLK